MTTRRLAGLFVCLVIIATWSTASGLYAQTATGQGAKVELAYDPWRVTDSGPVETITFDFEYQPTATQLRLRGGNQSASAPRRVPLKVYLPSESGPLPVVLFSHGLGGSRDGFQHGGQHWARRGYVAVFLQHPGSDAAVWRESALGQRMSALRDAASAQNLMLRLQDVKATIDHLELIAQGNAKVADDAQRLRSRMDLQRIGMSGHSFGAITTQMVSGQSPALPTQKPTDPRIKAAVVLSPSVPRMGQADRAFREVSIPWLLMTGTKDDSPLGDQTPETRRQVYAALPAGDKYQVVFDGGTHAFLGERDGLTSTTQQPTTHAQATVALSTAFWDTYLKQDPAARAWLTGTGPQSILAPKDTWETK